MTEGHALSWPALRRATPARIGIGRSGTALTTTAHLDFQLAEALAMAMTGHARHGFFRITGRLSWS